MNDRMVMVSKEDNASQILYRINQELLSYRNELVRKETNTVSLKNIDILFSYLRSGAFQRIFRRLNGAKSVRKTISNYKLKNYKSFPDCKLVVYTCIWGKYDNIIEPFYINPDIDYYIITDMEVPISSAWKEYDISKMINVNAMSPIEVNRFCKMLPHKLFPQYDYSIYVDGNIRVVTDLMPIIADMKNQVIGIHDYQVDCIYNMKDAIIAGKRAKKENVLPQIKRYLDEGFPKYFGAFECNVLVRKHMDISCMKIMDDWWEEFNITTSKRDQLSLPYVLWKNNKMSTFIYSLGRNVRENPRFQVGVNHLV